MAGCGWSRSRAIEWLESSQRFGIKLGLENTRRLLDALGQPERGLRFLHVAGTNGKGSVCAMLDSVLRQAGFKTGLYTSPHLVDFAERIRVNGVKIPDPELCDGLGRLRQAVRSWDHAPTYFELATVLAAWHFARSGCEWVVWETGMGGRLDATNVVDPAAAIITPIGLDHQQWLGETVGAIAGEKAGILKPGRPAVSSAQSAEAAEVLRSRAEALGVALEFVHSSWSGPLGLEGAHQRANAALAARALERAGIAIGGDALAQGLARVQWPGRFQMTPGGWVLDGAHNPQAAARLSETWRQKFPGEQAAVLFSCLADKEPQAMAEILEPLAAECHVVAVGGPRSADPLRLARAWHVPVTLHKNTQAAVRALQNSPRRVLVAGSLYLVGEALEALGLSP